MVLYRQQLPANNVPVTDKIVSRPDIVGHLSQMRVHMQRAQRVLAEQPEHVTIVRYLWDPLLHCRRWGVCNS